MLTMMYNIFIGIFWKWRRTMTNNKRTVKEWIMRLIILFIGVVITHFGVALFVISEMGADCFTTFVQGLSLLIGTSIGIAHIGTLCVLSILIIKTGYLKIGTIVCVFGSGSVLDLCIFLLGDIVSAASPMLVRVIVMLVGLIILSFGVTVMIKSDAGVGPFDLLSVILSEKIKKIQFKYFRMGVDLSFLAVGVILGGTFGLGTILTGFLMGPIMQCFMPTTEKMIEKSLKLCMKN